MFAGQRVRKFSWILAGAALLLSVLFFRIVQVLQQVFEGIQPPLMLATRTLLWVGPCGWSAFCVAFSAAIVLADMKFHPAWVKPAITTALWIALVGLCLGFACITTTTFMQPVCVFGERVGP